IQPDILSYQIAVTDPNIPALHWLGPCARSSLTRLCTGPLRSPQRQAILHFLHESPTPHSLQDILHATCYDYEAGRKMVLRMKQAGELVQFPSGSLYTTPNHPCLAHHPLDAHPDPVSLESAVPAVPLPSATTLATSTTHEPETSPPSVPFVPDLPNSGTFTPLDPSNFPVPVVPPVSPVSHDSPPDTTFSENSLSRRSDPGESQLEN
ncbi:MAG: hypothetical protein M3Z24_05065, partial [Chloroflexota bacterium]|nr:hypothetical protein [Chloroflexota bacterium]